MQPTPEIDAFIERIVGLPAGPGVSLDAALQPSLDEETELRKIFATDRQNVRLRNPHVGLVDVFEAPDAIRMTRARVVQGKEDLVAKYVMPISEEDRRKESVPSMVTDLDEFKKNWAIFTEGSLSQLLDWNHVVAAGGSVLACLTPFDEEHKKSKRAIRKYYHNNAYPTSDVDLFLWGMNAEEAEAKIKSIYEAVRDSVPWDVTCIRTKHTVSIHSQYPYRSVQIILRLYHSPAEILAGFDIDAPCCAYDGNRVWANPRSVVAMMRQCNTVDMTRRSPSYEVRLSKYSQRSYEVYVPTLDREKVDPTIYERAIAKMEGLARLLVLEKLTDDNMRASFTEDRRKLRGRPGGNAYRAHRRRNRNRYKGDLKVETGTGIEMNDYDVASLHIPYGAGWDARRVDKLIYQTDLGMNSTFNPKNKGRRLHRHPAFFGTVEECIEDCCENCPVPIDDDERKLQTEEDELYVRGRITFMEENPGRQSMTGSFNPIDEGEWSDQVYVKPTEQLFKAIAEKDRATVQRLLQVGKDEPGGIDLNHRDHVGRTTLHVALISNAADIAQDLIDAGARITARLSDGRAPMHLAAQYDLTAVVHKLFERSEKNKKDLEKKDGKKDEDEAMEAKGDSNRPSSEDDWSSHDDEDVDMSDPDDADGEDSDGDEDEDEDDEEGGRNKPSQKVEEGEAAQQAIVDEIPEDEDEEPDIIDINIPDFDLGFPALCFAVLFATMPTIEALLTAGADVKIPTKPSSGFDSVPHHPLSLALLRWDDEICKIAERLLKAGATCSTANEQMRTIFHSAVSSGHTKLVETMLRFDPNAHTVVNFPLVQWQNVMFPIGTAISRKNYAILALMVAHGAKLTLDEADVTRVSDAASPNNRRNLFGYYVEVTNYLDLAYQPFDIALKQHDEVAKLLIALGANVDVALKRSLGKYTDATERQTIKDWVDCAVNLITEMIEKKEAEDYRSKVAFLAASKEAKSDVVEVDGPTSGWKAFLKKYNTNVTYNAPVNELQRQRDAETQRANDAKKSIERMQNLKAYLFDIQAALAARNAKSWPHLYPDIECKPYVKPTPPVVYAAPGATPAANEKVSRENNYFLVSNSYSRQHVPEHLLDAYDDLYEACYAGDNEKIQTLCLPIPGQPTAPGAPNPLNISVRMVSDPTANYYSHEGYSPLFAAIAGRRWSTAKLILAIATAQYHPGDEASKIKFDVDVSMDDDSDDGSCNSEDSDITIEQKQITFTDIATRPSAVENDVHPRRLLEVMSPWRNKKGEYSSARSVNLVTKAVLDNDLEAFVHITNLYDTLPQPLPIPDLFDVILGQDQPDILDEYIRRSGAGINLSGAKEDAGDTEPIPVATNDENKIYLGLNVHGKKRADLARKNDPNAHSGLPDDHRKIPVLWTAIHDGREKIISYFASDRPLAAYRFYASTRSDAKAIWLKRLGTDGGGELEKRLPIWLGWTTSALGETPLSAAILGGNLKIIELLAKLEPKMMEEALQTNIKFLGYNPVQLAIRSKSDKDIMEYLLSKNVSPVEKDTARGWNIYHWICQGNDAHLLDFFLQKLPRDVNKSLLAQKSKIRGNTPLHIAVKSGCMRLVELLTKYSTTSLLTQDVDGRTPLHCAVSSSYSHTVKILLAVLPPHALAIENGVGNTPLEMAILQELLARVREFSSSEQQAIDNGNTLGPNALEVEPPIIQTHLLEKYEAEFEEMRDVVDVMVDRGTLKEQEKANLKTEVKKWLDRMAELLMVAKWKKAADDAEMKEKREKAEAEDLASRYPSTDNSGAIDATLELLQEHVKKLIDSGTTLNRQLIHILDVQKSVNATLSKINPRAVGSDYNDTQQRSSRRTHQADNEEGLEEEEDEDDKLRRGSLVFSKYSTDSDQL